MCYSAPGCERVLHISSIMLWMCEQRKNGLLLLLLLLFGLAVTTWTVWCLQSHLVCITYSLTPPFYPACLGGSPWHCRAPTVLIRVHVSRWHQPAALTYALYLQSSITTLSSQTVGKTRGASQTVWVEPARVCNLWYVQHPRGLFSPPLSAAMLLRLVMDPEWNWSPCPFVVRWGP